MMFKTPYFYLAGLLFLLGCQLQNAGLKDDNVVASQTAAAQNVRLNSQTRQFMREEGGLNPQQAQDHRAYTLDIKQQHTQLEWLNDLLQRDLLRAVNESNFNIRANSLEGFVGKFKPAAYALLQDMDPESEFAQVVLETEQIFIGQNGPLALFKVETYTYFGGVLGKHETRYAVYDLQAQKTVAPEDLIESGQQQALAQILYRLYQQYELLQELDEQERIQESLARPDNFTFTSEGVVFSFLPYQLGPTTMEQIDLILPYEQARGLIKPAYLPQ